MLCVGTYKWQEVVRGATMWEGYGFLTSNLVYEPCLTFGEEFRVRCFSCLHTTAVELLREGEGG